MPLEIIIVFGLILLAIVLFSLDRVPFDLVAMILMSALMLTGILDAKEGLSGFSNPATVTIAAMFALSKGIEKTGALAFVSRYLSKMSHMSLSKSALIIMGIIALISAFINNTAAVVIFIPVLMATAVRMEVSPSKLLIPLSFASMFGGVCTLLGTSTNILVSSIAADNGLEPFAMFEFTSFGLIILTAGFIYLYVLGIKIVPPRRENTDLSQDFQTVDYISDVRVTSNNSYLEKPLKEVEDLWRLDLDVIFLFRDGEAVSDKAEATLQEGDILRIRGDAGEIDKLIQRRPGLEIRPSRKWKDVDVTEADYELLEAVVAPDSEYDSQKVKDIDFAGKYEAVVLGVYKKGRPEQEALREIRLGGGDSVLLALREKRIDDLREDDNFVVVSDVPVEHYSTKKIPIALAVLAGVVLTAALNLVPIVVSACAGVILMVVTGCLRVGDIYRAVNWKVIFLLAGVIPLGMAMQKTGAARLLSDVIVQTVGHLGPRAVLSGYFLLTTLLTAMISNQATAAILASLAIETAGELGVEARPFLMAITYAASLSLITPWGYQTNTLIYAPGRYRFTDFTKVGAPLNLIFWILGTIFIPIFWQF
jgi:di/tricarboxylate transporter